MTINGLMSVIVEILIGGGVCWLLFWLVGFFDPPEPFKKIGQGIIAVVAVLFLINVLLGLGGNPFIRLR